MFQALVQVVADSTNTELAETGVCSNTNVLFQVLVDVADSTNTELAETGVYSNTNVMFQALVQVVADSTNTDLVEIDVREELLREDIEARLQNTAPTLETVKQVSYHGYCKHSY